MVYFHIILLFEIDMAPKEHQEKYMREAQYAVEHHQVI